MTGFLSLPREIRDIIYHHAFKGSTVKWYAPKNNDPATKSKLATSAALMVCSKTVYLDCRPMFFRMVRINITDVVDWEKGVLLHGIKAAQIRHARICQFKFRYDNSKKLILSLINLKSLRYYNGHRYYFFDSCRCENECCCTFSADSYLVQTVKDNPQRMIGQCYVEEDFELDECPGELPVRAFVAGWNWMGQPFELVAEVEFDGEY